MLLKVYLFFLRFRNGIHECAIDRNPVGRTGLRGRGLLGRWGPNHAADAIVTRWLVDEMNGKPVLNRDTNRPILQFVGIQRRHGNEWAIPGVGFIGILSLFLDLLFKCLCKGMVDAGEDPDHAAQREFLEETLNSDELSKEELDKATRLVADMFSKGTMVKRY